MSAAVAIALESDFTLDTMIPELLTAHPQAREVLDAYGLRGCGGRLGPAESLGFFARTHGIDSDRLMDELNDAMREPSRPVAAPEPPDVADTIYRRFFLGGIAVVLTAGASWGASILWQIGVAGKFTGVSIQQINAHGHAQVYGWVGLFVMGFAYQAFPRMWHTTLVAPRLAVAAFLLTVAGLVVRSAGMAAERGLGGHAPGVALLGGVAELLAILIFAGQICLTFRRSLAHMEPYVAFICAAVIAFIAQAGLDLWHTWVTMTAATDQDLLWQVATYQAPLRDLQVHGVALLMILGVSLRLLPAMFDLPPVPPRRAWKAFGTLTTGIVSEVVLFIAYRWTHSHVLAALLLIPWVMLAIGCWLVASPWTLWRPLKVEDRCGKFVRAAYAWLAVSLAMLLLLPAYQAVSHIPFSHAYYGAIRHAITVGFVSLMIMGVAAKVVPTLNGIDPRKLSKLWLPFALVNAGCFLRVSLQTLTDWYPAAYHAVGVSGMLEVTGLAIWGAQLTGIMLGGRRAEAKIGGAGVRPDDLAVDMYVADVLRWFPATEAVFDRYGFIALRSAAARRTLARTVTLEQATALRGIALHPFMEDLAEAARVEVRCSRENAHG